MKKILTFITFIVLVQSLFAKANLVVTVGLVSRQSVFYDESISFKATIKNTGDVAAGGNVVALSVSQKRDFSDEFTVTRTPMKSLRPNESLEIEFIAPMTDFITIGGNYYVGVEPDAAQQIDESDENNTYLIGSLNLTTTKYKSRKIPYPIIFIHGLVGDGDTWNPLTDRLDEIYGYSFGGQMNFCLNQDGDVSKSLFSSDYKDWTKQISEGDYYYINFATDRYGTPYSSKIKLNNFDIQSNQSAIFKQGKAVRDAIKRVLQINKCDKVFLVGHSMGGLASREYIQNTSNYQADGLHHVAKLFTIGTPHGGSNKTGLILGAIGSGIDEMSEATRDLRYPLGTIVGRFLFGGSESSTFGVSTYNNLDVNCNGSIGDNITGLNQRTMPKDINYACLIGTGDRTLNFPTYDDGIVDADRANLNIYPMNAGIVADTFVDNQKQTTDLYQHTELHRRIKTCIKGLDEPYEYNFSFELEANKLYYGTTTFQNQKAQYQLDYDDYKITIPQNGKIRIRVANLPSFDFKVDILNINEQKIVPTIGGNGRSNIDTVINVNKGSYFLEFFGSPNENSYLFPYAYQVDFTPTSTPTEDITKTITDLKIYPNPTSDKTTVSFDLKENKNLNLLIFNGLGQVVKRLELQNLNVGQNQIELDTDDLPSGLYIGQLTDKNSNYSIFKLLVEH